MTSSTAPEPIGPIPNDQLSRGALVVMATAPWCGSCRALTPVVEQVAATTGTRVVRARVDADEDLVDQLGVRSLPTLIAMRDGREVGRLVGLQTTDAVRSLFTVAGGTGEGVTRRTPTTLVMARALAGGVVLTAGLVLGSIPLTALGILGALWALGGIARR